jgi:hypothetical protein
VHEEFFHELQDEINLSTSSFSFYVENTPENLHMELIILQGNSMQLSKSFGLSSKSKYCNDYHLPEDDNHHSHRRGNLKSYKIL